MSPESSSSLTRSITATGGPEDCEFVDATVGEARTGEPVVSSEVEVAAATGVEKALDATVVDIPPVGLPIGRSDAAAAVTAVAAAVAVAAGVAAVAVAAAVAAAVAVAAAAAVAVAAAAAVAVAAACCIFHRRFLSRLAKCFWACFPCLGIEGATRHKKDDKNEQCIFIFEFFRVPR
ncbi:unnamed protein product [Ectocarpus sp. 6 AP-2014]